MLLNQHLQNGWALFVAVLLAGSCGSVDAAQTASDKQSPVAQAQALHLPAEPQELVRETMQNELKSTDAGEHFQFRGRKQTPKGSQTKDYVETVDGIVARLVAVDDAPLTPEQQQKEDQRLKKLLTDPSLQQKRRKQQQEDEDRVKKMLNAMPDAFQYQYNGVEQSNNGPAVRLTFVPNPDFHPPNRETEIYRGMDGTMLINATEKRLVEISGTLFQDVNFGWGIFGRLDRGGRFIVKQSKIGADRWETTEMNLRFTGKILLFKSLNINEYETESDFRIAPRNLTLAQGVELLQRQPPVVAQKNGAPASQ